MMDSEGIRLPPKPTYQLPTAVLKNTQLDLTPEKKSTMSTTTGPKQIGYKIATFLTENKSEGSKEIYSCLAQPSMNSTNRVSRRLAALQKEQFNAALAIAEELEQSETAKTNLGEKVAQAVNVKQGCQVYTDLVPLDVRDIDVLAEYTPGKARSTFKTAKPQSQEPDIMAFFSEEFETQTAHLDYEEFYKEDPLQKPTAVSISHVFDLHQHIQCWHE